ncbi:serpin-ZX-like [Prosopis cineraria]|nr:serpin-ZX-like [Prosopis cineraria]
MTRTRSFNLLNGQIVRVPFMTSERNEKYYYRSYENYKVLTIPYQSGSNPLKFAMYFFLPHEKDGLPNLIHTLSSNPRFLNKKFKLRKEKFSKFWIPRFKFSFNLKATEDMEELGLTLPFTAGELTEVSDSSSSNELYVSNILQKAFVEVNEEGTEAVASTAAMITLTSYVRPRLRSFVADHPFMFMIREETSRAVFFIGAVLNPLNS